MIFGDLKINDEVTLNGTIGGSLVVGERGSLIINGILIQELLLEKGSKAEFFGTVNGVVRNRGGELRIKGPL